MNETFVKILKQHPGEAVSGEVLSRDLGVSRAAVNKAVQKLISCGYEIHSKSRVGYELIGVPDYLYPCETESFLKTEWIGRNYLYFSQLDSTNTYAKTLSMGGFQNGTVIVAEQQTDGRGRRGKSWQDLRAQNLAISILLKPDLPIENIAKITILAAQAVCSVLRETFFVDAKIKWPNDIICNGKKLCGILTEMGTQEGMIEYLVVGIGLNINTRKEEFDPEIRDIAVSLQMLKGEKVNRKIVLAEILNRFERLYTEFLKSGSILFFLDEYKKYCVNLGMELMFDAQGGNYKAVGIDVDESGRLLVKREDGIVSKVLFGEVSVRGIYLKDKGDS